MVTCENTQPEIVIFRGPPIFVEVAGLVENPPPYNCRRRTYQARVKRIHENVAIAHSMPAARVHSPAVSQPYFFGLRYRAFRVPVHELQLRGELSGHPQIVRVN